MKDYTIFNNDTFKSILHSNEETLNLNLEDGDQYVEGAFANDEYYIKDGVFLPFPDRPDYPCTFDKTSEAWIWNEQASWAQLRYDRDQKLIKEVDPIVSNPLRWAGMSASEQQQYQDYRLALLNLPENTVDPRYPVWPEKPS